MACSPPPKSLQKNPQSRGYTTGEAAGPPPTFPLDVKEPDSYAAALGALQNGTFFTNVKFQAQQFRADWTGAHPDLVEFHKAFQARMRRLGVPMFAVEVLRTPERQNELQADGFSRAKAGQSPHQFGLAMDYVHSLKAWNISKAEWAIIGHIGKEVAQQRGLKMKWGGDFTVLDEHGEPVPFWDPAHWEVAFWKTVKEDYPW